MWRRTIALVSTHYFERAARGDGSPPATISVTPEIAGWTYLSFQTIELAPGEKWHHEVDDAETALVPLSGSITATAGGIEASLSRTSVFTQMPSVLYAPPRVAIDVTAETAAEFAVGWAPAEGRYPARLFEASEMKSEVRGGGRAHRQVNHILAPPLPAERLILYEVYIPRGMWSGWPPHCHDGYDGSPYLEETYYFRLDPDQGFCIHRNWRVDEPFEETMVCGDRSVALVTKGYHSTAAAPGSHMFFLNFLAGELVDEQRTTPPCFHEDWTWIEDDWDAGDWHLPVVGP